MSEDIDSEQMDDTSKYRYELPDEADVTEQDEEYHTHLVPRVAQRVRHWHHWRLAGIGCALAGIFMLIGGHFGGSGRAMSIAGFLILAGALVFAIGVIGGWITRQRPLD
jgi:hypothetical protein